MPFEADAGDDKQVSSNQPLTISATDINEPAIYNWFDMNGNLIFQGKNLEISNAIAQKYKLEVISTIDGFKDYTEVEVKMKPSFIESIIPNPSDTIIAINYNLTNADSSYMMIIGNYGSNQVSNNYIIDVNLSNTIIDISNYSNGFYTLLLIVNGEIVDVKTIVKQ